MCFFPLILDIVLQFLQLPMQSVPITINVVSSNPAYGEVYSIQLYVIKFVGRSVVSTGYSGFLHQ
jgi:hypothetical protein